MSLLFDGNDDNIYESDTSFIDDAVGSLLFWTKLNDYTAAANYTFASITVDGATDDEYGIYYAGSSDDKIRIVLRINGGVTLTLSSPVNVIADNNWHHIGLTSDGSTIKLYVDAVIKALSEDTGSNTGQWFVDAPDANVFSIGAFRRATPLSVIAGNMAETGIWNIELSQALIQSYMYKGLGTLAGLPNLRAYWPINDAGSGVAVPIKDLSGNGNNGIMNNFAGNPWKGGPPVNMLRIAA